MYYNTQLALIQLFCHSKAIFTAAVGLQTEIFMYNSIQKNTEVEYEFF